MTSKMTREEILNQGRPVEPDCFETDREEQWYKVGLYDGATARIEWHTTADMPETGKRCLMEYEADGEIRYRVDWRSEYEWVETCHYDRVLRWTYVKDILI